MTARDLTRTRAHKSPNHVFFWTWVAEDASSKHPIAMFDLLCVNTLGQTGHVMRHNDVVLHPASFPACSISKPPVYLIEREFATVPS